MMFAKNCGENLEILTDSGIIKRVKDKYPNTATENILMLKTTWYNQEEGCYAYGISICINLKKKLFNRLGYVLLKKW